MLPQVAVSFDHYRAFHREIEVTRQLRHPNIVELIDDGSVKGAYYCVLEFVDGTDLKRLMRAEGGRLSLADAAPIMLGTLEGLAFAHRVKVQVRAVGSDKEFTGIVHRDLKPENILLARAGDGWVPKVADFGLAKSFESAGLSDMTIKGVCGTPAYWPREQITHYRYLHPATDVFSIGCVFYELLTGAWARPGLREMFERCKLRKIPPQLAGFMRVIAANPIPPLHDVNPAIPIPVAAVIDRSLLEMEVPNDEAQMRAVLQSLRYPDAGVFHEELALALKRCGIRTG
jgi:serine/threonine protein kinase